MNKYTEIQHSFTTRCRHCCLTTWPFQKATLFLLLCCQLTVWGQTPVTTETRLVQSQSRIFERLSQLQNVFSFKGQTYQQTRDGVFRDVQPGWKKCIARELLIYPEIVTNGREALLYRPLSGLARTEDFDTVQLIPELTNIKTIKWDGSAWVALTDLGLFSSENGQTWLPDETAPYRVRFASNLVVRDGDLLLGLYGGSFLKTKNGVWEELPENPSKRLAQFVFKNQFLTSNSAGEIYLSDDAKTWRLIGQIPRSATLINGETMLLYQDRDTLAVSHDAVTWTPVAAVQEIIDEGWTVTPFWTGHEFFIDASRKWFRSEDGKTWHEEIVFHDNPRDAAYGNGRWLALVNDDRHFIQVIEPNKPLSLTPLPDPNLRYHLTWSGHQFALLSSRVFMSLEGLVWEEQENLPAANYLDVVENDHSFVFLDDEGRLVVSPHDQTDPFVVPTEEPIYAITWDGTRFIALAGIGAYMSTTGQDWQHHPHKRLPMVDRLASGNGAYVAVGKDSTMLFSNDGMDWQERPLATQVSPACLQFNGHGFLFSDWGNKTLWTSRDGKNWDLHPTAQGVSICPIWDNGKEAMVLESGLMRLYEEGIGIPPESSPTLQFILPWIVHNENWQSEIVFTNQDLQTRDLRLVAITTKGHTISKTIILPAHTTQRFRADQLFENLTGYALQVWSNGNQLATALVTLNTQPVSGGASPAGASGFKVNNLQEGLIFPYLPSDQIPAVVVVANQNESVVVTASLFGNDGAAVSTRELTLQGGQPAVWMAHDLFPQVAALDHAAIEMVAEDGTTLIGTSFIFNDLRQPSMTPAISFKKDSEP